MPAFPLCSNSWFGEPTWHRTTPIHMQPVHGASSHLAFSVLCHDIVVFVPWTRLASRGKQQQTRPTDGLFAHVSRALTPVHCARLSRAHLSCLFLHPTPPSARLPCPSATRRPSVCSSFCQPQTNRHTQGAHTGRRSGQAATRREQKGCMHAPRVVVRPRRRRGVWPPMRSGVWTVGVRSACVRGARCVGHR